MDILSDKYSYYHTQRKLINEKGIAEQNDKKFNKKQLIIIS